MGLASIGSCKRLASHQILSAGYWLKVAWINALSISAQVIYVQPLRDSSDQQLVGKAMGINMLMHPDVVLAVTIGHDESQPLPATCYIVLDNLLPELLDVVRRRFSPRRTFPLYGEV